MVRKALFVLTAMLIIATVALIHRLSVVVVDNTGVAGGLLALALVFALGAIAAPHLDR